jgi:hypothetical protein
MIDGLREHRIRLVAAGELKNTEMPAASSPTAIATVRRNIVCEINDISSCFLVLNTANIKSVFISALENERKKYA